LTIPRAQGGDDGQREQETGHGQEHVGNAHRQVVDDLTVKGR